MGEKSFREYLICLKLLQPEEIKEGALDNEVLDYMIDEKKLTSVQCKYLFESCLEWRAL